jgi:hypothetical protein
MLAYFLLLNQVRRYETSASQLKRLIKKLVSAPIQWRLDASLFFFPWELWLSSFTEQIVRRRSLVNGTELSPVEAANVC